PVPVLTEGDVEQQLRGMGVPAERVGGVGRLAADGASEDLVRTFGETVRCLEECAGEDPGERARSAAERFLFERLQSLPETAGLFSLNPPLDFRFGAKNAEADLVARDLRLAIEVDGYFHFVGADAYRRDRRKDWELQRRGYLVLRFLAEDVVARMEEMLDTILAAVDHCRRRLEPAR